MSHLQVAQNTSQSIWREPSTGFSDDSFRITKAVHRESLDAMLQHANASLSLPAFEPVLSSDFPLPPAKSVRTVTAKVKAVYRGKPMSFDTDDKG